MSVLVKVGAAIAALGASVGLAYGIVKLDEHLKSKKNIDELTGKLPGNELADVLASHGVTSVKALNS